MIIKYIYKITQKEVPDDLWEDYGNYLIAGVGGFLALYVWLIYSIAAEDAGRNLSNRRKFARYQYNRKLEKNDDNNYKQNYEYENDDDENEAYA